RRRGARPQASREEPELILPEMAGLWSNGPPRRFYPPWAQTSNGLKRSRGRALRPSKERAIMVLSLHSFPYRRAQAVPVSVGAWRETGRGIPLPAVDRPCPPPYP